ncbi:MAG: type II toxin-antitoxin system HicA family toxin [Bryobacteraceae bacterium]
MKPVSGPELCRILESAGWKLPRIRGSHHVYSKVSERKILSVPVHGNQAVKPGLANRIAKDAGL